MSETEVRQRPLTIELAAWVISPDQYEAARFSFRPATDDSMVKFKPSRVVVILSFPSEDNPESCTVELERDGDGDGDWEASLTDARHIGKWLRRWHPKGDPLRGMHMTTVFLP